MTLPKDIPMFSWAVIRSSVSRGDDVSATLNLANKVGDVEDALLASDSAACMSLAKSLVGRESKLKS